jgi:glyoxylase I family protein
VTAPVVLGLSHLALSVRDLDAAGDFWTSVLGFESIGDSESLRFLVHRDARIAVVLTDHAGAVTAPFDEHRTGLDHLALAVPDLDELQAWQRRLAASGVPHSAIAPTDAGHHLNLRAPDGFPIELYVMSPGFAAELGLPGPREAVARGH